MSQILNAKNLATSLCLQRFSSKARFPNSQKFAALLQPWSFQRFSSKPSPHHEDFLSGTSSVYVEAMYQQWLKDQTSVHASWQIYFHNVEAGLAPGQAFSPPPYLQGAAVTTQRSGLTLTPVKTKEMALLPVATPVPVAQKADPIATPAKDSQYLSDSLGLAYLIRSYQVRGHQAANLDPLGLHNFRPVEEPPELNPEFHGFKPEDWDRTLNLKGKSAGGYTGFLKELSRQPNVTLRQVYNRLRQTYCSTLGVEYMHITSRERCNWIRDRVENPYWLKYTKEQKMHIYERLVFADTFETYLNNKFNTSKRFGLDGGESVIVGLKAMIDYGSKLGLENFTFGMPHRGRLNVLANVLRKPMPLIFKEFQDTHYDMEKYREQVNDWSMSGDVKYHLGTTMTRTYPDGRRVNISLLANPSHLETVDPVVIGKTRANQFYMGDREEDKMRSMGVIMHGDAAIAGQGIVYEVMQLAKLQEFNTGGTIHVVVNNQVGFTTDPSDSRSTPYCTDIAKAFGIPILHCNGDDPLSVVTAFEMAIEWRQDFMEDIMIDVICYRRNGHNELDQPMFTQPVLYQQIAKHPSTVAIYEKSLLDSGSAAKEELDEIKDWVKSVYDKEFDAAKTYSEKNDWIAHRWEKFKSPRQLSRIRETGVDVSILQKIGIKTTKVPKDFILHRQLEKILESRRQTVETGRGIDWATAEALAFGTLLMEGNHVRLTGQDVERGTFSHRHAVLHNQKNNETYTPLNHLVKHFSASAPLTDLTSVTDVQAKFTVANSILSEYAVMGVEVGFSLENPNALVVWEAQFGDFVNGAQVMLDTFVCAGENKWMRQCGITLLLPHGYDGQGPEHSSCRMERFLQNCDDDEGDVPEMEESKTRQVQTINWQVVNCTTPANYYHVLRRQVHRDFRKPLIVIAPKSLLRHKLCVSTIEEMGPGTRFKRVFGETNQAIMEQAQKVRRLIICTGKIYYELLQEREKRGIEDIAIIRLEQIAPIPFDVLASEAKLYGNAEIVWVQEEPKNMGAWSYVQPRIRTAIRKFLVDDCREARYVGRAPAASPATGMSRVHKMEQEMLIENALEKGA